MAFDNIPSPFIDYLSNKVGPLATLTHCIYPRNHDICIGSKVIKGQTCVTVNVRIKVDGQDDTIRHSLITDHLDKQPIPLSFAYVYNSVIHNARSLLLTTGDESLIKNVREFLLQLRHETSETRETKRAKLLSTAARARMTKIAADELKLLNNLTKIKTPNVVSKKANSVSRPKSSKNSATRRGMSAPINASKTKPISFLDAYAFDDEKHLAVDIITLLPILKEDAIKLDTKIYDRRSIRENINSGNITVPHTRRVLSIVEVLGLLDISELPTLLVTYLRKATDATLQTRLTDMLNAIL